MNCSNRVNKAKLTLKQIFILYKMLYTSKNNLKDGGCAQTNTLTRSQVSVDLYEEYVMLQKETRRFFALMKAQAPAALCTYADTSASASLYPAN